jgi:hypothetical protein
VTIGGLLGGGSDEGGGKDGCDAESEHTEMSLSELRNGAQLLLPHPALAAWQLVRLWAQPCTLGQTRQAWNRPRAACRSNHILLSCSAYTALLLLLLLLLRDLLLLASLPLRPRDMWPQLLLWALLQLLLLLLVHPSFWLLSQLLLLLLLQLLLLLLRPDLLGQGRPWLWRVDYVPRLRQPFFASLALACTRLTGTFPPAEWQGASCHGLPHTAKTTLPQLHPAMHARYWSSNREAAGSRERVAVVVVADPRQVLVPLLAPLSTPYGGGGVVAGWLATPSSGPFTQEREWGEELVVGAQLDRTFTPDRGLHYTERGYTTLSCCPPHCFGCFYLSSPCPPLLFSVPRMRPQNDFHFSLVFSIQPLPPLVGSHSYLLRDHRHVVDPC